MFVKSCLQYNEAVVEPFTSITSVEGLLAEKKYLVVKDTERFYGLVTPTDVLLTGHQLAVDCITPKMPLNETDPLEKALLIMNTENQFVLPVFRRPGEYVGSATYLKVLEEIGLLKKQPTSITINNVVGSQSVEEVKQHFLHDLYHNIHNPLQIIYSSLSLLKDASTVKEKENLIDSINTGTHQVEDVVSKFVLLYFGSNQGI